MLGIDDLLTHILTMRQSDEDYARWALLERCCRGSRSKRRSPVRYAAKVDANQAQVVAALRAAGATVEIIGLPVDLLVGIRGRLMLMEVKDGAKSASRRTKTVLQERIFAKFDGYPISLVDGPEAALRHLGVLK
jgi:hypothetical protein